MITFSGDHLQRLVSGSEPMLARSIGKLVREHHAYVVDGLPDDLFGELIARGIATARHQGLETPQQLGGFVMLQFEVGPEFYRHHEIQAILGRPSLSPQAKFDALVGGVPDRVWAQIDAALNRQTWFPERREAAVPGA